MKFIYNIFFLVTILIFSLSINAKNIVVRRDIAYKQIAPVNGISDELKYDIYLPDSSISNKIPLIIFLHGGGFHAGEKEDPKIVELCKRMANSGYAAAAIEYRTGIEKYTKKEFVKTLLKGMYDTGDFLNYITTNADNFGIDTSSIFIGGISSGAVIALHLAYWDLDEINTYLKNEDFDFTLPKRLSSFPKVCGILNCWGLLLDPSILSNDSIPILTFHGKKDKIVPYKKGHPMHIPWLPKIFGGYEIHKSAKINNITSIFHTYKDLKHGHEENTTYMDTTFNMMSSFIKYIILDREQYTMPLIAPSEITKIHIRLKASKKTDFVEVLKN